jgi:cold shock CspA family protein
MQGTVSEFDDATGAGAVLLDNGTRVSFPPPAFAVSGLRLLRIGQRIKLEIDEGGQVTRVALVTMS